MTYSLPPTQNCLNKMIILFCRICPQLVHTAHFMSSTPAGRQKAATPPMKAVPECLQRTHPWKSTPASHPWVCPKLALTTQRARCPRRVFYLSAPLWKKPSQCKGTNILSGKNNSSLPQSSPQEDLMGQLHNWDYDMTSQDRSLPFSSREAQGKGPAVQERVSCLSSPGKPQGHLRGRCQMASRAPFKRRVWKALKNGLIKGLGTSCHSKESAPSQQQSPGCELQGP